MYTTQQKSKHNSYLVKVKKPKLAESMLRQ